MKNKLSNWIDELIINDKNKIKSEIIKYDGQNYVVTKHASVPIIVEVGEKTKIYHIDTIGMNVNNFTNVPLIYIFDFKEELRFEIDYTTNTVNIHEKSEKKSNYNSNMEYQQSCCSSTTEFRPPYGILMFVFVMGLFSLFGLALLCKH